MTRPEILASSSPTSHVTLTSVRLSFPQLFLLTVLGASVLLTGCSSSAPTADSSPLPDRFPNHTVAQIQRQIHQSTDTLRAFSAEARVTVRSPEENRSFNAVVRQRRADSLFMRFSLFGVEGGRLLLTSDSLFFYDSRKGVLRVGPSTAVQEIFPAPADSDRLFENMLGLIAPASPADWTLQADRSLYYLSSSSGRERYAVDPTRWRVVRYVKETPDGTVLQKRQFSGFNTVDGIVVPHRLVFQRPADGLSATVTYRTVDLNPSRLPLTLDVPPQVPRKPFR